MVASTVTVTGGQRVIDKLNRLGDTLSSTEAVLDKSADAYYAYVAQVFDTEGSGHWAPLSPMRIRERTKPGSLNKPRPILNYYGQLREAATSNEVVSLPGVTGGQKFTRHSVELTLKGDKVRNNDGFKGKYTVPAREFWPFYDKEYDVVFRPFETWADVWLRS